MGKQTPEKVFEDRMRRAVSRQGYVLAKDRIRDPGSPHWGWYIVDPRTSRIVTGDVPHRLTIEDVERWVNRPQTKKLAAMRTGPKTAVAGVRQ
jgi:hypothetical protein